MRMIIFNIGLILLNVGCLLLNIDNDKIGKTSKGMSIIVIIILFIMLILRVIEMGAE